MKKNILVYAAAASMMMLQACTSEEVLTKNDVLVPGNSEMEIKLSTVGGGGTSTEVEEGTPRYFARSRAAITGNELTGMGVFCLAREKQAVNNIPADIDWTDWSGCVMKNVQSNLIEDKKVTWEGQYFYPISQFYAYDFYGYYPYVADNKVTIGKESVQVQFTLTGKEDLIWGRATSEEQYAYSAKYFRVNGNQDKLPTLDLKHMLTRLIFVVKTGEDFVGSGTATEALKMKVKSLCIKSAKPNVNLSWTNTTETATSHASLTLRDNSVTDFYLCDAEGGQVQNFELDPTPNGEKQIGESIMLYPEQSYILEVVLVNSETQQEYKTESPLTLSQKALFEAGKNYNVIITVHGPKKIDLTAQLNPWVDAEDETDNEVEL